MSFAEQAGINAGRLSYWKWRLSKDGGTKRTVKRSEAPTFIEVTPKLEVTPQTAERIELVVKDDVVVRVPTCYRAA